MQYNEYTYNGSEYNLIALDQTLVEDISSADTLIKDLSIVKIDSQASVDMVADGVTLAAILDTITILHQAQYGNPYNSFSYNEASYNAVYDDDEILLGPIKALSDSFTATDVIIALDADKGLSETITGSDVISSIFSTSGLDFIFLSELFRIEVSNKSLPDTVQLNDWLSIKRLPANPQWFD